MKQNMRIGFLGAGKMGGILLRGMLRAGLAEPARVMVFDVYRDAAQACAKETGVAAVDTARKLVTGSDVVFLCVKPQQFVQAAVEVKTAFKAGKCAVSIMAGVPSAKIQEALGGKAHVVRVMPNIPCLVGQGAAAVARDTDAPQEIKDFAFRLFDSLGASVWVDEKQMDAVTALSGSGPAYVFMFLEALADAGVTAGLDRATSEKLALQTVLGSAAMAAQSEHSLCALRAQVSSPAGTTVAATGVLESRGFRGAVIDAVTAAWKRSIELGK
jgi:pyrroline-5-carboxylate reductase